MMRAVLHFSPSIARVAKPSFGVHDFMIFAPPAGIYIGLYIDVFFRA
jgi:hypothetical protein